MTQKKKELTDEEQRAQKYEKIRQLIFSATNNLQFGSLSKVTYPTYTQYDKESYRQYIQSPGRNEKQLRDMSQFLTRVSMP